MPFSAIPPNMRGECRPVGFNNAELCQNPHLLPRRPSASKVVAKRPVYQLRRAGVLGASVRGKTLHGAMVHAAEACGFQRERQEQVKGVALVSKVRVAALQKAKSEVGNIADQGGTEGQKREVRPWVQYAHEEVTEWLCAESLQQHILFLSVWGQEYGIAWHWRLRFPPLLLQHSNESPQSLPLSS